MAVDKNIYVLIVDDYQTMRGVIRNLVNQSGFHNTIEAATTDEAFEKLKEHHCGLVIFDWRTGPMAGEDFLKTMRADPDLKDLHLRYAAVSTPIYAVAALDDAWALPNSRHAFMQYYRQANVHYIDLKAEDYGLKDIGHMGYFRQGAEKIWQDALNTFSELHRLKYAA